MQDYSMALEMRRAGIPGCSDLTTQDINNTAGTLETNLTQELLFQPAYE
jgi:hypothetical protein